MVLDKESGQFINLEELIKRSTYRCLIDVAKNNDLSPAAFKTNCGSGISPALQADPGLDKIKAFSKKRKAEDGADTECVREEKRTCV